MVWLQRALGTRCTRGRGSSFDNVHFTRDNRDVPSDLEQMPHLLTFLEHNGVLLSNEHTPLITRTADDILTTLTGVYGDKPRATGVEQLPHIQHQRHQRVGLVVRLLDRSGREHQHGPDADNGKIAPAPWVPYTRAGCDVGGVSTANIEVENADPDLKSIYGVNSPEWQSVLADKAAHDGFADISNANYQGIAVHCAHAWSSVCAKNPSLAAPDNLPDEPAGYNGDKALYGNLNVAPVIGCKAVSGSQGICVNDRDGLHRGCPRRQRQRHGRLRSRAGCIEVI